MFGCMRVLVFMALAAVVSRATLQAACKDDAICSEAEPSAAAGSALLQFKTNSDNSGHEVADNDNSRPPKMSLHHVSQRICVQSTLQDAHLKAVRKQASLIASGVRVAPAPANSILKSREVCSGKTAGDACTLALGQDTAAGQCAPYGTERFCDIGQFKVCRSEKAGDACETRGVKGQCTYATGYKDFDHITGGDTTVSINACQPDAATPVQYVGLALHQLQQAPASVANEGAIASLDAAGFKSVTSLCC